MYPALRSLPVCAPINRDHAREHERKSEFCFEVGNETRNPQRRGHVSIKCCGVACAQMPKSQITNPSSAAVATSREGHRSLKSGRADHTGAAGFQVFTTGLPCLILVLAGSQCVVSAPKEIDAEIGARLAEVRRHCGLTQRQLAKAVGVTITTMQDWERGRHRASREAPWPAC